MLSLLNCLTTMKYTHLFAAAFFGVCGVIFAGSPNTAPTLDSSKSPMFQTQTQNAGAPSGAVGTLVSDLVDFTVPAGGLDNVTDPDPGALLGLAIVATNATNGSWFYSINGGGSWLALGTVTAASARLLAADANDLLYFQPTLGFTGTISDAITFRAWDRTSGTNGTLASTLTNGGTTAFSVATDTASLAVVPEPATSLLLGTAAVGVALARLRRRSRIRQ